MYNRSEELKPDFKRAVTSNVVGNRKCNFVTFNPSEANAGEDLYITLPKLEPNTCIVPDTMCLSFEFKNSNAKSWFLNNLGRLLCKRLMIKMGGEILYDNDGESLIELYKDLWLSDEKRAELIKFGIANENTRKLISKDDSADQTAKTDGHYDRMMLKTYKEQRMRLGKILNDHGPYAPYAMKSDLEYIITLPKADKIMVAQASEAVAGYALKNIHLKYETIENEALSKQVNESYDTGRTLSYEHATLLRTSVWRTTETRFNEEINIPRKSMRAIVLLFRKAVITDSEEFVYPNVERVKVTIEGNPNAVYSQGLTENMFYDEASRLFGSRNNPCCDNINVRKFYGDKFALVIDLRAVNDAAVMGSGKRLLGSNPGVTLEIETLARQYDVFCNMFVLSDGLINISDKAFQGVEY